MAAIGLAVDKTLKYTIGRVGVADCDFNFAAGADHAAQTINMGAIIPKKCKVIDIQVVCVEAVVGVADITLAVGNTNGGAEFIAALSCDDLNEVVGFILATLLIPVIVSWTAATNIYVTGDPSDNTWNLMTAGKWEVYITYRSYLNE